jgi:hypothetical protein
LLAAIVARTSGVDFQKFLQDEIFLPAGMTATAVPDAAIDVERMAQSCQGRFPEPKTLSLRPAAALGSSSVYASLEDMAAWVRMLRKAKREPYGGAWTQFIAHGAEKETDQYAFGLWRGERQSAKFLGHLGLAAGYRISFRWFPDRDLAVVYMTNDGSDATYERAKQIEDMYLGLTPHEIEVPDAEYVPPTAPPLDTIASYSGTYRSAELNTAYEVAISKDQLVARHPINGEILLTYRPDGGFTSSFPFMPSVRFRRNGSGEIDAMIVSTESARNMVFQRVDAAR